MDRTFQFFREYPAVAGIGFFLAVSLFLAVVLGTMMHKSGASLRPLVFFFGFLAIVGIPQASIHLVNARMKAKSKAAAVASPTAVAEPSGAAQSTSSLRPVDWKVVFGPKADPDLITDAKRGLEAILKDASEAKLSFNADGESALAAKFPSADAAAAALNRYGSFFQFANASGSDAVGWTAKRFGGQGEWNHVVAAGNELYAWTGATRESVVANRVRALGAFDDVPSAQPASSGSPDRSKDEQATDWLRSRPALMAAFVGINLVFAVGWFFKASAWSTRTEATPGTKAVELATLRDRLLAVNHGTTPVTVSVGDDGETVTVDWRYADAQWFDLMRAHKMRRTQRLVLHLDAAAKKVRVREYWSSFDASASPDSLHLDWKINTGMMLFAYEKTTVLGAQLDPNGVPTGELMKTFTFDLQAMKRPVIDAVTGNGWHWQPVMWTAPAAMRWLTD
jgi:hypothetical protein